MSILWESEWRGSKCMEPDPELVGCVCTARHVGEAEQAPCILDVVGSRVTVTGYRHETRVVKRAEGLVV